MTSISQKWKNAMSESISMSMAGRMSEYKASAINEEARKHSNDKRKASLSKKKGKGNPFEQTPKKIIQNRETLIEQYANKIDSIYRHGAPNNPQQINKVKKMLEGFFTHMGDDPHLLQASSSRMASSSRIGIGNRQFQNLQQKYHQSQAQGSIYRVKIEQMEERIKAYQREIINYRSIDRMMGNSIQRQNELRQQINKIESQKIELIKQLEEQNSIFKQELNSQRTKMEKLKMHFSRV